MNFELTIIGQFLKGNAFNKRSDILFQETLLFAKRLAYLIQIIGL